MTRAIALLTDFGLDDHYVGVMKAVALGICSNTIFLDLSHQVPPQNIRSGAYLLATALPYLPRRTVTVAVVDPGVGSSRRSIAARTGDQVIVCPDNGLLSLVQTHHEFDEIVSLDDPKYYTHPVSSTFHGRDVFMSCGAHICRGTTLKRMGTVVEQQTLVTLDEMLPFRDEELERLHGRVLHVDHFGNVITSITRASCELFAEVVYVHVRGVRICAPGTRPSATCERVNRWPILGASGTLRSPSAGPTRTSGSTSTSTTASCARALDPGASEIAERLVHFSRAVAVVLKARHGQRAARRGDVIAQAR